MVFKILRPDSEKVWKYQEICKRFKRYREIIDNYEIARYLVAKRVKCEYHSNNSIEELEKILADSSKEFNNLLKKPIENLKNRPIFQSNYITLAKTLAEKYLESCIFCERKCKVNRISGEKGYCEIPKESYISSAFLHMGEEAPLIPSGTIFFQGCNFGCVFCQNYDISQAWKSRSLEDISKRVSPKELANIAENLVKKGAININYVGGDPIPNIHSIVGSMNFQQSNMTQLWNSNFYLTERSLSLIIDLIDFWLPDFKYGNNECGKKYSGVENYYDILTRNLKRIHNFGSGEIIIRHLVMPNHIECCSKPILDYIAKEIPNCVVNIMGQYRPEYLAYKYSEINRRPTNQEMMDVRRHAEELRILYKPL